MFEIHKIRAPPHPVPTKGGKTCWVAGVTEKLTASRRLVSINSVKLALKIGAKKRRATGSVIVRGSHSHACVWRAGGIERHAYKCALLLQAQLACTAPIAVQEVGIGVICYINIWFTV